MIDALGGIDRVYTIHSEKVAIWRTFQRGDKTYIVTIGDYYLVPPEESAKRFVTFIEAFRAAMEAVEVAA